MWLMKTLLTSGCTNQRGAGHGNRFYIVRNPEVTDITILSPKLEYTEHYGPASGAGDKANILFIKGVGKTKGIYRMYFRDDKSTFTFLCP